MRYRFNNRELLEHALRHRSHTYAVNDDRTGSNERMEFLGDAVLNLVVTEFLYKNNPKKQEGILSQIKSLVVSKKILGKAADDIELGKHLYLSVSEEKSGGRKRLSIVADAFEALIAAIYLDGGLKNAAKFIENTILHDMDGFINDEKYINYKSLILEATQSLGLGMPVYSVVSESGPDHDKTFEMKVYIKEEEWGSGVGKNKKTAEQEAARCALSNKREILQNFIRRQENELFF